MSESDISLEFSLFDKITILCYARDHTILAASKKYHVDRNKISERNKELKIFPVRTRRQFTIEQKIAILNEVPEYGLVNTAQKYNIVPAQLSAWNQQLHVYETEFCRIFSDNFKRQAVFYANMHGVDSTARVLNIDPSLIYRWMTQFLENRVIIRKSTLDERTQALTFARDHGYRQASVKFHRSIEALRTWNQELHIVPPKVPTNQVALLRLARYILPKIPLGQRSPAHAFKIVGEKYNLAPNTMYIWNLEHQVVPTWNKVQLVTPDDLASIKQALDNHRGRRSNAAAELGLNMRFFNQIITHYNIPVR